MKLCYQKVCSFINWRFFSLYGLICLFFIGLIGRLIYLQLINYEILLHEGDMRSLRTQNIDAIRGTIRDRAGRLLAISVPVYAICVNPKEIFQNKCKDIYVDQRWKVLSETLSIPLYKIFSRLHSHSHENFLYLARQISSSVGEYILNLKIPGVFLRTEMRRYYPCAKVTAHIVGITDIDGHGIEGAEKSFDSVLSGRPGQRIIRKDCFGRVIENISSMDIEVANNVFLSIDERLQTFIYHELNRAVLANKAESGSAVLVNIESGEILAMVNSPSYDPNNLSIVVKQSIRNRAISDLFEPGSTVKPLVILAALYHGIIQEDTLLDTSPYFINGYKIKDVVSHDTLTVKEILQKSSNVGVSKLALKIPYSFLIDTYFRFGIGQKTNLGLIGESCNSSFLKKHGSNIERATLSYGYGLMVTPLQLAKVYATIGSMGVSRPFSIVRKESKVLGEQIFPLSLVRTVINMMDSKSLFTDENEKAIDEGYRMAIKTGTVKKVGRYGKYINNYIAYAAGIAPINNPKFALVVVINEPRSGQYYGGVVSSPIFRKIMRNVVRIMDVN